jgi:tRNA pseudouridine38-40 synthase
MARYRLTVAYDGRPHRGWQSQATGNTIQDLIEAALAAISGEPIRLHASGRTDTGVHALGQVVHFDTPAATRLGEAEWHRAINALLPASIRIMRCQIAAADFHARYDATSKVYRYRIIRGDVMPPHEVARAWHVFGCLDIPALRQAAALLVGRHDFSAFCANRRTPDETEMDKTRTLHRVEVEERGDVLTITLEGDGFLYKMVRMLVGTLIHIARGRAPSERLAELLAHPTQEKPGWQAPADGLYLVSVNYAAPDSQ